MPRQLNGQKPRQEEAPETQCPVLRTELDQPTKTHNNRNEQGMMRCRVCLETEEESLNKSEAAESTNHIVGLPCACKRELGCVHQNCMKFWIKIWIQSKIESIRSGRDQLANREGQRDPNNHQSTTVGDVKVMRFLDVINMKEGQYYPFLCEVCLCPIYFDVTFHRRIKQCSQISTKDLLLFFLPLLFTVAFLAICISWILNNGVNLYLVLFYLLVGVPVLIITLAFGAWTFTVKEFWVKGLYSYNQLTTLNISKADQKQREQKEKQVNKENMYTKFLQLRNKILRKRVDAVVVKQIEAKNNTKQLNQKSEKPQFYKKQNARQQIVNKNDLQKEEGHQGDSQSVLIQISEEIDEPGLQIQEPRIDDG